MRTIERTNAFKRDYKREKKSARDLDQKLIPILKALAADELLPVSNRDHPLSGDWSGFRDCHVKPDLVLIYQKADGVLRLVRLGSHSELFG
ncbi:MAG TPA: type II toxin-antitoxin system YafQ family toxin [Caulobacteraceae bacterium]